MECTRSRCVVRICVLWFLFTLSFVRSLVRFRWVLIEFFSPCKNGNTRLAPRWCNEFVVSQKVFFSVNVARSTLSFIYLDWVRVGAQTHPIFTSIIHSVCATIVSIQFNDIRRWPSLSINSCVISCHRHGSPVMPLYFNLPKRNVICLRDYPIERFELNI